MDAMIPVLVQHVLNLIWQIYLEVLFELCITRLSLLVILTYISNMFVYMQEKLHPKYILANRHILQFISYTSASCSHERVNQYYLESILNQANREGSSHNLTHHFMSTECES